LRAHQAALPAAAVLAGNLAQALVGTPFRAESFAPFLADVAAARAGRLPQPADLAGTALGLRLESLLVRSGGRWLATLPLRGVEQPAALAAAVARFAEPGLMFIDLKAESDGLLADYLREALTLSIAGAVVIVLLLAASLRAPGRIARVLAPLAASVACTAAIMLAAVGQLSIFNLFGLLLVVAVGSNYCLFFEREPADAGAVTDRVLASLTLADLCTVIGFGVLSFSAIPVLRGIGATVAVGAVLCLVFGAVLSARRVV
jgi:predicted exporter